jgi:hypothetical protein
VAATAVTDRETRLKAEHEKKIKELEGKTTQTPPVDESEARFQAMIDKNITPLKAELEGYKQKEASEKRTASILAKAKELGISQARIDEGFAIAADADDAAIGEHLAKVAKNDVSRNLEGKNTGFFPKATPEDQAKAEAEAWAKALA